MIALDVGDYTKVREVCESVFGTEREPDALHCLAMVHYREHQHELAIDFYDRAIALGCRDPATAHWNKNGRYYACQGKLATIPKLAALTARSEDQNKQTSS